jgi:uncharacterized protein YjbJ (UPF0337 family)
MTPIEIEGNLNVAKGELKQKFALLTNDNQLLDESKHEVSLGRQQINLVQTKEELFKCQTPVPTQWFSDWVVDGGERRRIEVCESEAKNKKYDLLNMHAFLF